MLPNVISVHLPKTAGSSFAALLEAQYGSGFIRDYGDMPLHQSAMKIRFNAWRYPYLDSALPSAKDSPSCIHGHFLPYKYRFLTHEDFQLVTWLRDPVDRLASHFNFWRRDYNPETAGALHRRMIEEQWSFERFALGRELRNVYSRFLWRTPLERFAFIGIFEHMAEDTERFNEMFCSSSVEMPSLNRGSNQAEVANSLAEKIRAWHAADQALYDQALSSR